MRRMSIFAALAAACIPGISLAQAPKLELKPCSGIPGLPPDARCGTYEVWENREAKSGRKIPLRVVVLPAKGADRLPDPFVFFTGGPGDSSVSAAPWINQDFGELRKHRDILLVDFRGTGGSGGLFCPELQGSVGLQGFLDDFLPAGKVKQCAERLGKTADLTQYTNATSVDDIEEVRTALGYGQVNLFGTSGGSRSALVYMRRHPRSVRTATLWGVVPMDERGPFQMARSAQLALDGLIAECEGDAACRAAFPKLREETAAILRQVEQKPVTVRLTDGETGKPVDVHLTRNGLAQTLRYLLYGPGGAALLPLNVHLAAQGDWQPMAEAARFFGGGMTSTADGYYLALTCAEDLAFLDEKEIPAGIQGTFLGDFRIRKQQAACAAWPTAKVGREFMEPVVSDIPVLLISGERDPVTPAANAARVAKTLRNSLNVVVPDGGHGFEGIEGAKCVEELIVKLVEAGTVQGLDASCVQRTRRPQFVLQKTQDVELSAGQLALLAGSYKEEKSGMEVRIEVLGNRLRALVGEQSPLVLVPTSPTRFRFEGLPPGFAVVFEATDGRATSLTLEQPGGPPQTLKRIAM